MPTIKEMIEVMRAYEAGSKIECMDKYDILRRWVVPPEPSWDWSRYIYRIKKEPKRVYVISYEYGVYAYTECFATKESAHAYIALVPGATIQHEFWAKEEV